MLSTVLRDACYFLWPTDSIWLTHMYRSQFEKALRCTFPPLIRIEVAAADRSWRQLTNAAQQLRIAIVKWHFFTWYALDAGAW